MTNDRRICEIRASVNFHLHPPLTSDDELALVLHGGGLVACDAGVVAVVHQGEIGDAQGACEVYVVYSDAQAGRDWPTIFLPGDEDGLVARHDHTGDENSLANGKPRELKWVDGGGDCRGDAEISFTQLCGLHTKYSSLTLTNVSRFMCV